ncbi:maleate cis-trans isomerase family protein [Actinomadura opuntiae]|uniref:maleate cis-trans isomerase family protein n=1 Tax=Actinomadura sp. OS1-43 TaxID=604315 RepID=UPI00255AE63D|nr:Asp/Glu racemase [Actinomadura sp. OS1-43]MDL4819481.1 Asp/Glu racemase [Actinomadura sp. OS1-43]
MTFDPTLVVGPELVAQQGVGVVAPFDFALDRELWRWTPDDVSLFMTRLPYVPVPVTVEMASALSDQSIVRQAVRDVLSPEPLAVAYACASGSFIRGKAGELQLHQAMRSAGAPAATTTSGALVESLRLLDAGRIAVVTPYIDAVTERLVSFLGEYGIEVVASVGMGLLSHIWKVGYGEIVSAVSSVDRPEAEAVFISCTNVPTYDIIAPLEQRIGKPVLTANQVTMCSALRAMGRSAAGPGQSLVRLARPTAA